MKKFANNSLNIYQKKETARFTQGFIEAVFTNKFTDKNDLLCNIIKYVKDPCYGEPLLKQTISKGCLPRLTWTKEIILKSFNVSSKILNAEPKELSDVRFIIEVHNANAFVNSSENIKQLMFNSENPQKAVATISNGNMFKDVKFYLNILGQDVCLDADIKSGNNAMELFKGSIGLLPLMDKQNSYQVLNTNILALDLLQEKRILHLENLRETINNPLYNDFVYNMRNIVNMSLDSTSINNLIQEEFFKCLTLNVLKKQPSFYTLFKVSTTILHEKYFQRLEPYINNKIFDNKENFNFFMQKALIIYNETIFEIAGNVKDTFWKGTGFEHIADDIFK